MRVSTWQRKIDMSKLALILAGAVAMALIVPVASQTGPKPVVAADGTWVDGSRKSCELACRATGRLAWVTGRYRDSDYVICRVRADYPDRKYATRPGFQHHAGSPNVCKVQGLNVRPDGAGRAWLGNPDLVSDEVLWRFECLCHHEEN